MRRILVFILIVFLISAAIFYLYNEDKRKDKNTLVLYGNVDIRQVDLGFRINGRVNNLFFEEGDLVMPGALMATLDRQPYEDELKQTVATMEASRTSFLNAEIQLKRRQELIGEGGVSQEDLDNTIASKNQSLANFEATKAAVSVSETNLGFTELYAPTEGTILTRIREPGSVVNNGSPVYTLSILSPVWVRAYVTEPELGLIFPGMEAEVFTDTENGHSYKGKIGFISPVAEFTPKTVESTSLRTDLVYRIRIYADNPDHGLRQGMPVTVKIALDQKPRAKYE